MYLFEYICVFIYLKNNKTEFKEYLQTPSKTYIFGYGTGSFWTNSEITTISCVYCTRLNSSEEKSFQYF